MRPGYPAYRIALTGFESFVALPIAQSSTTSLHGSKPSFRLMQVKYGCAAALSKSKGAKRLLPGSKREVAPELEYLNIL